MGSQYHLCDNNCNFHKGCLNRDDPRKVTFLSVLKVLKVRAVQYQFKEAYLLTATSNTANNIIFLFRGSVHVILQHISCDMLSESARAFVLTI